MDYMFEAGFIGTRAPFFMDFVTLIVAILPLLMFGIISLARFKKYKLHAILQVTLFIVSVVVLTYFETGVRVGGGFKVFMEGSSVDYSYALVVLIAHIIISIATLTLWFMSIFMVKKHLKLGVHKKIAFRTFIGVILTSLSGMWVYALLFIY